MGWLYATPNYILSIQLYSINSGGGVSLTPLKLLPEDLPRLKMWWVSEISTVRGITKRPAGAARISIVDFMIQQRVSAERAVRAGMRTGPATIG